MRHRVAEAVLLAALVAYPPAVLAGLWWAASSIAQLVPLR